MKVLLGSHYFVYFGVMGIVLPYFNLFCRHLGFSGFEIGILSSVRTAAVIIFPVIWAVAADRLKARKFIFIICTSISALFWSLLIFTREFLPILFILSLYSIFYAPIIAFLESFAMDILGNEKKMYGKSRAWGTIAFVFVSLLLGKVLLSHTTDIIIPMILAGMLLQMILAFRMPGQSEKRADETHNYRDSLKSIRSFFSLQTVLFLSAAFLMLASHGAYYGFFSIYLESLGVNTTFIGFAWALASIAEIVVMIFSDRIFARFELKTVLVFSFAAAFVRWFLLYLTSLSSIPSVSINSAEVVSATSATFSCTLILVSQLLHAFTYAAFHVSSILAVDRLSPEGTTFGQAVNNAVTYGAGMMVGFLVSGIFYDKFHGYLFLGSAFVALSGGVIMLKVKFDS